MSKAEQARINALEARVAALEQRMAIHAEQDMLTEVGADHEAHKALFPRKTLTLKAKQ